MYLYRIHLRPVDEVSPSYLLMTYWALMMTYTLLPAKRLRRHYEKSTNRRRTDV